MRTVVEREVDDRLPGLRVGRAWPGDDYRRRFLCLPLLRNVRLLQSIPSFEVYYAARRNPSLILKLYYRLPGCLVIGVKITSRIAEFERGKSEPRR